MTVLEISITELLLDKISRFSVLVDKVLESTEFNKSSDGLFSLSDSITCKSEDSALTISEFSDKAVMSESVTFTSLA